MVRLFVQSVTKTLLLACALLLASTSTDLRAQSCGAIGGDYCSQNGSCPAGFDALGLTSDCKPCCKT